MPTIAFRLQSPEVRQGELVAWLDQHAVSGLLQEGDVVTVYSDESSSAEVRALIQSIPQDLIQGAVAEELIADRNWNADWEKTITPIRAGIFRVRPTWGESVHEEGVTDILIDPKMSFGTGHHESTRMLLSTLSGKVAKDARFLDAGTGTGVLAFAGLMLGATHADAFDYDPLCLENAAENADLNGLTDRFNVFQDDGTNLDHHLGDATYDVITANINREVLRSMLSVLEKRLKPGGLLGLAGLLLTDAPLMRDEIGKQGLTIVEESEEGEWWSVWAGKTSEPDISN
jgi:ribosomal protein L11 methyltransferase